MVKNLSVNAGDMGLILGQKDALEKEIATHSLQYSCLGNPTKDLTSRLQSKSQT